MTKQHMDVLYDSAAALRLVDHALRELGGSELDGASNTPSSELAAGVVPAPAVAGTEDGAVRQGVHELRGVLATLRSGRQLMDGVARERLQHTNQTLEEVSVVTESAAVGIIHGLERALALLSELDEPAQTAERGSAIREKLRNVLDATIGQMQFQDITCQQLRATAAILSDVDGRIVSVLSLLAPDVAGDLIETPEPAADAAMIGLRGDRQVAADEVVAAQRATD